MKQESEYHSLADLPAETGHEDTNVQAREKVTSNWWSYLFRGAQPTPKNVPKSQPSTKREWDGDRVEGFQGEDGYCRHFDIDAWTTTKYSNHGVPYFRIRASSQDSKLLVPGRRFGEPEGTDRLSRSRRGLFHGVRATGLATGERSAGLP